MASIKEKFDSILKKIKGKEKVKKEKVPKEKKKKEVKLNKKGKPKKTKKQIFKII